MTFSSPVDGFRLAYDRVGSGLPVVLLHGWPGDRTDYRDLVPLLAGSAQVIVPDLRGFGRSDKHLIFPREWSDRLDEYFTDVSLEMLDGVGHYTPLEAPDRLARAIKKRLAGTAFS
jgi:pimeloyl-ACP methyl ester carboxylesterase